MMFKGRIYGVLVVVWILLVSLFLAPSVWAWEEPVQLTADSNTDRNPAISVTEGGWGGALNGVVGLAGRQIEMETGISTPG